jgi:hypothetical protein
LLQYTRSFLAPVTLRVFCAAGKISLFDLKGLDQAARAWFQTRFDVYIYLHDITPVRGNVNAGTFSLAALP